MVWRLPSKSQEILTRLNHNSVTNTFVPEIDIDWSSDTTDEEYLSLYRHWSLFTDSKYEALFDDQKRVIFSKYQQMNLMMLTAIAERYLAPKLHLLLHLDDSQPFREYVAHFIKEEGYHHTMFLRANDRILETIEGGVSLPQAGMKSTLRWFLRFTGLVPWRRLRIHLYFLFFSFAEEISVEAHRESKLAVPREGSFVRKIWELHAIDERRHLIFDRLIMEYTSMPRGLGWLPRFIVLPWALLASFTLHKNEFLVARKLGIPVRTWHLRRLLKNTKAPFKLRVLSVMSSIASGKEG